jgi:hypothetical protein
MTNHSKKANNQPLPNPSIDAVPTEQPMLDLYVEAMRHELDPGVLASTFDSVTARMISEEDETTWLKLFGVLFGNPRTPAQTLWQMQTVYRGSGRSDVRDMFDGRWSALEEMPPPLLQPDQWNVSSVDQPRLIATLILTFSETQSLQCLLVGWRFTKEFLLETKAPNLDALLQAFQDNPASPADVIAEAMSFQVLD